MLIVFHCGPALVSLYFVAYAKHENARRGGAGMSLMESVTAAGAGVIAHSINESAKVTLQRELGINMSSNVCRASDVHSVLSSMNANDVNQLFGFMRMLVSIHHTHGSRTSHAAATATCLAHTCSFASVVCARVLCTEQHVGRVVVARVIGGVIRIGAATSVGAVSCAFQHQNVCLPHCTNRTVLRYMFVVFP